MAEAVEILPACVIEIAAYWRKRRPTHIAGSSQPVSVSLKANQPGRNDPCPCGSGRQYKACCGVSSGYCGDRRGASFIPAGQPTSDLSRGCLRSSGYSTLLSKALAIRDWLLSEAAQLPIQANLTRARCAPERLRACFRVPISGINPHSPDSALGLRRPPAYDPPPPLLPQSF